ncbi:hypothetical protein J4G02_21860 [Candidatus Poribacteria bacterium]|nr:hypothetical protein [Candidatus Poribacteria bacterium]
MKKSLFILITFVSFATGWNTILAESTANETPTVPAARQMDADTKDSSIPLTLEGSVIARDPNRQADSPDYPLFRSHASKYYPPKIARTAILLSATLPGLGQTYSGRPVRGLAFLTAGLGLIAAAGFNIDRAVHYDDLSNRFNTGFYDPHDDNFLTADQMRVKARGHAQFGVLFLASGIGVYIWNIFDAAKTVNEYNERRFPVQAQQNVRDKTFFIRSGGNLSRGETYLTVNRRF